MKTLLLSGLLSTIPMFIIILFMQWFPIAAAAKGKLPRGSSRGLITRATVSSDEAWLAAHRAALPIAKWIRNVAFVWIFLSMIPALVPEDQQILYVIILTSGYLTFIVIATIILAVRGHRAAKEVIAASAPKS